MAGNLFSGIFFALFCHCNFLTSLVVLGGYISSSALNTVFFVVLEHPNVFSTAVICTILQLLYDLIVPFPYSSCIL